MVIIESATHSDNSVVAIVEGRVNGNRLVAAVRVGGGGRQNGATIDSNHVVNSHGKGNAITKLLSDALKKRKRRRDRRVLYKKRRLKICVPVPGCNCPDQLHRMASFIVYSMPALLSTGKRCCREQCKLMLKNEGLLLQNIFCNRCRNPKVMLITDFPRTEDAREW